MSIIFPKNFTRLRAKKGITQEKMAEQFGVSRSTIAKWESGASIPHLYIVDNIADFFEVSIDELLHGDINHDCDANVEEFLSKILFEIRKNDCNELYKKYCDFQEGWVDLIEYNFSAEDYHDFGCEEAEKGNYDDALKLFEEAVIRGNIDSINCIMAVYNDMLQILADKGDEVEYRKCKLQQAKIMQDCGKILEKEIKKML